MKYERRLMRELLKGTGMEPLDAARLVRNISDCKHIHLSNAILNAMSDSDIYRMGLEAHSATNRSVGFRVAAQAYIEAKEEQSRKRTNDERRQVIQRVLRAMPEWADRPVRQWSASDCHTLLLETFPTRAARNKAYSHLRGLFRFAVRNEWCTDNPWDKLEPEKTVETELVLLTLSQMGRLLKMASNIGYRACAPAVGLMLWAGIRPAEVCRMKWTDIDLDEGVAYLQARHSKTGGPRQITLQPVLRRWLNRYRPGSAGTEGGVPCPVTPSDWVRIWRDLRTEAGLQPWRPDTLRHTFASYHLKRFHNLQRLQEEMGHSNPRQLRTRYLNMRGITAEMCDAFWRGRFDENGILPKRRYTRKGKNTAEPEQT